MFILKGCESNCEVNFQFLKEMKQLPCIKQVTFKILKKLPQI